MNDRRDSELTSSDKNIKIRPEAVMFMHQSIETPASRPPGLSGEFNIGLVLNHR